MSPPMTIRDQALLGSAQASPCTEVDQQQLLTDDNNSFGHNGGNNSPGIKFETSSALGVGAKLASFTQWIKLGAWDAGITALVSARLYDSSGVLKETSTDTINPQTELNTSSYTEKTLNFSSSVVIAEDDHLVFYFDSGIGTGGYMHGQFYNSDVYDGVNTVNYRNSSGFSGEDCTFKLTYCE